MNDSVQGKCSETEFAKAIKDLLISSGIFNKLQAEMRAKVIEAIKQKQDYLRADKDHIIPEPPKPTEEVLLINELVREYLEWNGYLYTASVMESEAGMAGIVKSSRAELCAYVGVKDDEMSSVLPLLSNIVAAYTERIKRKMNKHHKKEMKIANQ